MFRIPEKNPAFCNFFAAGAIYFKMTASEYNQCVSELADRLYRFAWKSLEDRDEAQDVVQQSFMALWEKRIAVPPDKASSFLFTIAYRKSMDRHRKRRKVIPAEALEDSLPADPDQPHDIKSILQRALAVLDQQARNLVLLKDYEGYSYEEIARLTGLSVTQVKVYLHRARRELRSYLVNKEYLI